MFYYLNISSIYLFLYLAKVISVKTLVEKYSHIFFLYRH